MAIETTHLECSGIGGVAIVDISYDTTTFQLDAHVVGLKSYGVELLILKHDHPNPTKWFTYRVKNLPSDDETIQTTIELADTDIYEIILQSVVQ